MNWVKIKDLTEEQSKQLANIRKDLTRIYNSDFDSKNITQKDTILLLSDLYNMDCSKDNYIKLSKKINNFVKKYQLEYFNLGLYFVPIINNQIEYNHANELVWNFIKEIFQSPDNVTNDTFNNFLIESLTSCIDTYVINSNNKDDVKVYLKDEYRSTFLTLKYYIELSQHGFDLNNINYYCYLTTIFANLSKLISGNYLFNNLSQQTFLDYVEFRTPDLKENTYMNYYPLKNVQILILIEDNHFLLRFVFEEDQSDSDSIEKIFNENQQLNELSLDNQFKLINTFDNAGFVKLNQSYGFIKYS